MSEKGVLRDYVSDMLGLEKHIDGVIARQATDDRMLAYAEAHDLVMRASSTLKKHRAALEKALDAVGGENAKTALKRAATSITAMAGNLYDKARPGDPVSSNLRDDYTALNMAAVSYTMLHTTALALKERSIADLAVRHLEDLTPLIMELSEVIPDVVARELTAEGKAIDPDVGSEAVRNTQKAWMKGAQKEGL